MSSLNKVYSIAVDIKNVEGKYSSYAKFFDDDRDTSIIKIKLLNNNYPIDLEGCTVEAEFILANNTYHDETCKIINTSEGIVELQLCQECLVAGKNTVRLSILKENEIANTPVITYEVKKGLYSDNPNFNDDPLTPVLSQMLLDVKVTKANQIELQERYEQSFPRIESKIKEVDEKIKEVNLAIASGTQDLEVKEARANKKGIVYAKLGDRLDEVDSQLEQKVNKDEISEISVKDFGAKGDGVTDDTQAFKYAIDFIKSQGTTNTLFIPKGDYIISDTLQIHSGLHLKGAGRNRLTQGTTLRRKYDKPLIQALGDSVISEDFKGHVEDFILEDIKLMSMDFTNTPMVDLTCVGLFRITNCFFFGKGTQLLIWEGFDSRIENTDFDWGGDEEKKLPAIELRSTNGDDSNNPSYEYTNQIYFTGCRFESYPGYAIKITGYNTNEIFITNCKFESVRNTVGHLHFNSCGTLLINNVQVCLGGYETDYSILFNNVQNSNVYINFEVVGRRKYGIEPIRIEGNTSGNVFSFMTGEVSQSMLENEINCLISTDLDIMQFNRNNIDMIIGTLSVSNFKLYPLDKILKYEDITRLELEPSTGEASIKLSQKNQTGFWDIGRVGNDGRFVFVRYDGSNELVSLLLASNGEITSFYHHFFRSGIHLAQTNIAPWTSGNGTMYLDNTNTIPTFANSINGKYRHISYAEATPTEGNWERGTIIYNTNPAIGQPIGWVCTETGTPGIWSKFGKIEQI